MDTEKGFVKGQKVITPAGEGAVTDVVGNDVNIQLDAGEHVSFPSEDVEDNSDAG